MIYKKFLRPVLFKTDSEHIHDFMIRFLSVASPALKPVRFCLNVNDPVLAQSVWDLRFTNPVGLAAGFDKNAEAMKAWPSMGFGFAEIGTITAQEQPGNTRPRIFRLISDEALINRCGFNNQGAVKSAERLKKIRRPISIPLGINIGKSKTTELAKAHEDYRRSFDLLWLYGDYFAVNVSSPNTPDLRTLQEKSFLRDILSTLMTANHYRAAVSGGPAKPILVKIAPDLSLSQIDDVIEVALENGIQGIIVSNTTIRRDFNLRSRPALINETGGLSGTPLKSLSTELIRHVYKAVRDKLVIIGVGGIQTGDDAFEKIAAGASLVQVYTGFVYEGPFICRNINKRLIRLLRQNGFHNITEAVGHQNS